MGWDCSGRSCPGCALPNGKHFQAIVWGRGEKGVRGGEGRGRERGRGKGIIRMATVYGGFVGNVF